jgi:hypothetical protein
MAMRNKVYPFIFKNKAAVRAKQTGVEGFFERLNHKSIDVELPLLTALFVKKYIILNSH